jgi:N-formylglutamate amidohydrolase
MTDWFVDEVFSYSAASMVRFPFSRLVVDVERFADDSEEPMSRVGMGIIYKRTAAGGVLRRQLEAEEEKALLSLYDSHHRMLTRWVEGELARTGKALIVDCHSFPSRPLPCDQDQWVPRPQFCLGTDALHTPEALVRAVSTNLVEMGYSVGMNQPYAGTMVPKDFWQTDQRVGSIMIEVNRSLYLDEETAAKTDEFRTLQSQIHGLLSLIREFRL